MSSLIEQAAERLEQLRRAGVTVPTARAPGSVDALRAGSSTAFSPDALVAAEGPAKEFSTLRADAAVASRETPSAAPASVSPAAETPTRSRPTTSRDEWRAPCSPSIELDLAALAANNIVTPTAPRSHVADEFRVIKRPLITNARRTGSGAADHANLIMVTSAVAGEGKSFTSINLAMSIAAELDTTVMLVDADLARPSLPRMLGVPEGPGLLDVLDGSAEMSNVLLRTNVDKLTFLRGGTPHPRATELLASEAMRRLLDDMARRYADRIIVFDSPPLLLTTEARTLAINMGQIVFVVRAGKTQQSAVANAIATIENCPQKMILLNQTRAKAHGAYGEYGLGYGYGYGYGYAPKRRGA